MATDRRTFLQLLTTGALSAAFPASIARALEIPAHHRTGTIEDVEHIVIMMQENRSFDHYFGTLRGVRGFGDPRAVNLPSGQSVFHQPNGGSSVLPFHPGAPNLGLQFIEDLAHDWTTTHAAWNGGKHDQWVPQKGTTTMAHLNRSDIPFHFALADGFTVCDAYHCSLLGPTDPNRYHMWTGWVGNDGQNGGPVIDNAEAGYGWSTYPEVLEKAGVSWKVYQDIGLGTNASGEWGYTADSYIGNYGDNALLYFNQYRTAEQGSPLFEKAKTGTNLAANGGSLFEIFQKDVLNGTLPKVSYVVAPEAYTEHPNWPANYGAWYVSQVLDALTANPEVWSKTAFFLMYDENDGFFDHMVPPTPPQSRAEGISTVSTKNEIFPGNAADPAGPYGLGLRVPMVVISPWSKGGWVNSEVFDHTSLIRFIEKRFGHQYPGLHDHNITEWRHAVSGDLTSAFNFASPNDAKVVLPKTTAYLPPDDKKHPDYKPVPPVEQALPKQEAGMRPARALPYNLRVTGEVRPSSQSVSISFENAGPSAAVFHVRSSSDQKGPWTYTVGPRAAVADEWSYTTADQGAYDLSVYGPNGFLRSFKGDVAGESKANLQIKCGCAPSGFEILLDIRNAGVTPATLQVLDGYTKEKTNLVLKPGQSVIRPWHTKATFGWYDLTVEVPADPSFQQQLAGHIENGKDSMTDPAIGRSVTL